LEENEYIRSTPCDAALNCEATLDDIDEEKIKYFLLLAIQQAAISLR
jgi:hypothetical protein